MTTIHTPEELTINFKSLVPSIKQTEQVIDEIADQLDECALLDKPEDDPEVQNLCEIYVGLCLSLQRMRMLYLTLNN